MSEVASDDPPPYRDPIGVHGRHLITCRTLWYDPEKPEAAFGLAGLYAHIEPPEGSNFPQAFSRFFVYFQLWGDPGDYNLRLRLVRIATEGENEGEEIHLGADGQPREFPAPNRDPIPASISGLNFVDEFALSIGPVVFPMAGLYEYQLWAEGLDEPIATERVQAREWNDE